MILSPLLLTVAMAAGAPAHRAIHRCEINGQVTFTERPCNAVPERPDDERTRRGPAPATNPPKPGKG